MRDEELIARLREGATWDDDIAAADRIEELEAKLANAEWMLIDAMVQLREGKAKTRRNRADLIDAFLAKIKGEQP